MKNRINFLQHNYNLQKNTAEYYEALLKKIASEGGGLFPAQNIYVLGEGNMERTDYSQITGSQIAHGKGHKFVKSTIDQSMRIGSSFKEKEEQVQLIKELMDALRSTQTDKPQKKDDAIRNFGNVSEELKEEANPDPSRIKKWLNKAKSCLGVLKLGKEVVDKAKELFESFDLPF